MKKFTLFFMSLFCLLGTAMAKDEAKDFNSPEVYPSNDKLETIVYNIRLKFAKEITVTMPEGGFEVVNDETKEVIKVTRGGVDEWDPYSAVFNFEQKEFEGKDGPEMRDQYIETPGKYTYTIPAGMIESVDGDKFPETTYHFTIVKTFGIDDYSPKTTSKLDKVVLTFSTEITAVNIPASGMYMLDNYWMPVTKVSNAVISDDKKSVTLELEEAITTPGTYNLDIYQGVITSADGVNTYSSLSFKVGSSAPSFSTNYKDGDKVKEIGDFEISFENVKEVKLLTDKFTLYLPGGGEAEGTATLKDNKIIVTYNQEFTEEGEYLFHIPAGSFTMDGAANEESMITINLQIAEITPLEILSVTPEVGKVDQIEKIVIQFNQPIQLSYNEDWQQISREITLTSDDQKFTLTYAPDYSASTSDKLTYLPNAQWNGYDGYNTTPITADGTYTLDLSSIVIDYGAEEGIDEWGYPTTIWNAKNYACEGTYTWVIGSGESAIEAINAESGKKAIYDILGRRIEKVTGPGIYIVNGKKVILK